MSNEITIVGSMGYPDEIFEVTKDLIANWEKYALIVSHTVPLRERRCRVGDGGHAGRRRRGRRHLRLRYPSASGAGLAMGFGNRLGFR
jgi:hypothetical protein